LGVREANPEATVRVVWTNTWFDPAKERAAAEALLDAGADVIAQHQDTPGPQQAAEDRGVYGVGYNSDMSVQAPEAVLTSPIWHWGEFYIPTVQAVMDDTWESSQIWAGWQDGLVGLAPIADFVPEEHRAAAEEEIDRFESGEE
ncbi:MAG: BMP family ABC transporter substrate-binding protein, partial [Thermomicrobiales bacterium]